MAELLIAHYKSGLERYESRLKNKENKFILISAPPCKIWDRNLNIKHSNILLFSEQGLEDTIQLMRYAIVLKSQEISVSLCAQSKLHTLIQASDIDQAPLTPEQAESLQDQQRKMDTASFSTKTFKYKP